jgi:hypothetical protein
MASYTALDLAEFLAGGDGELDDLHPDCPKIGIAGPHADGTLSAIAYVDGAEVSRHRVIITPES